MVSFTQVNAQKTINVKYVDNNDFNIDGVLNEEMWQLAETSGEYYEYFPTDTKLVTYQTEIKMLYNEGFLYIGIKAYAPGKNYKTPSYERDFSISGADVINLMFDTYSDRLNAFLFGINPFGVVREGTISNGGITGQLDLNWDTKWDGESTIYDDYAISEIRIPMAAFKFEDGTQQWKFNSMRSSTQSNTKSSWSKVPQNQNQLNLGYFGDMIFEFPLKGSKSPISIIPYITPSFTKDYISDEDNFKFKAGFDVKIPVQNSFMLDLTVNPDFSNEDVVSGQNNITRFEIKEDETRQFFIDNGDLFNEFGLEDDALAFYSRRVGVGTNQSGNTVFVPIDAGAKFTGKINNNLRIGILDVQTRAEDDDLIPSNNNLVLAAEQKILGQSNIGFFFINREATSSEPYSGTKYNRVVGSDLKFFSKNNDFDGHLFVHKSFTPDIESNAISTGTKLNLDKLKYNVSFTGQYIDEGFQTDLGYTRRKDIVRAFPSAEYKIYPKKNAINTILLNVSEDLVWMPSNNMQLVDSEFLLGGEVNFTSGASIGIIGSKNYEYLDAPFDPVGDGDGEPLPIGKYYTEDVELNFNTDKRNAFWLEGSTTYGSFYNGTKFTGDVNFKYRIQPIFFVSLKVQYDDINLPDPYSSDQLWYIGPTINFTFTKSLFWNTDIQYSSQSDSFFLISRIQWIYAPLSEVFLTYTDYYQTSELNPVEKGIFLKINYWLDIRRKFK